MSDDRKGVSRRGLFDVLGRGFRELKGGLEATSRELSPRGGSGNGEGSKPAPGSFPRIVRPPEDLAFASAALAGTWNVDMRGKRLAIGESVVISGGGMPENVILVRVHEQHWAACTAECGVDGSDVEWSGEADRLQCPACKSSWRLDGQPQGGPCDYPLGRVIVDAFVDDVGDVEIRLHAP